MADISKNENVKKAISKCAKYLNMNVNSSYPNAECVNNYLNREVELDSDFNFSDDDVKTNEDFVKLLLGFLACPDEKYNSHMRSKISKMKQVKLSEMFVTKKNCSSLHLNNKANISLLEYLELSSGYFPNRSNSENVKSKCNISGNLSLYVEKNKVIPDFVNMQCTIEEFKSAVLQPIGRNDFELYVDLSELISILDCILHEYEDDDLTVKLSGEDLINVLFYLPVLDGKLEIPCYLNTQPIYSKTETQKTTKKYIGLNEIYNAVCEQFISEDFYSLKKVITFLKTKGVSKYGQLVLVHDLDLILNDILEKQKVYDDELENKKSKKFRANKKSLNFSPEDNYWHIDLSSKTARDKVARQQHERSFYDLWSESLLNGIDYESGSAKEIDNELLSRETLQKMINNDLNCKKEQIPLVEFYSKLDLLIRDLNEKNIDHFSNNVIKTIKLLKELDNRDLLSQLQVKECDNKLRIEIARIDQSIISSLEELINEKNTSQSDRLKTILENIIDIHKKNLSKC